jgi:hypothetical protein
MLGGSTAQRNAPPLAGPAQTPVSASGRQHASGIKADHQDGLDLTPWVLVGLLALWMLWALVERHQRVAAQIQPRNIALNLRNLGAIVIPVILGISLLRIGLVKLKVLLSGIPYAGPFVAALIKIVG